jgi:hypothetical protein
MEKISNFQYIWNEWVEPLVDDLYEQLDEEFKIYCNVKIRDLSGICSKAEKYYQKKREEVKKAFYGEYHKGDSETEHRMDFHKIGAILCRTLIEYKVYSFDTSRCKEFVDNVDGYNTNWVVKNALINFRLAFYVSVVFLYQSMLFEYETTDIDLYNKLADAENLDLYEPSIDPKENTVRESFENCMVLDLAKRDIGNQSFDYLMYAIVLYQLEQHNKYLLS